MVRWLFSSPTSNGWNRTADTKRHQVIIRGKEQKNQPVCTIGVSAGAKDCHVKLTQSRNTVSLPSESTGKQIEYGSPQMHVGQILKATEKVPPI